LVLFGKLISFANLSKITEVADSRSLNRYNRVRAVTIEANLADGLVLGDALDYLEGLVRDHLPDRAQVDYKGQSRDFRAATLFTRS
jgi:multidrug efflux pump